MYEAHIYIKKNKIKYAEFGGGSSFIGGGGKNTTAIAVRASETKSWRIECFLAMEYNNSSSGDQTETVHEQGRWPRRSLFGGVKHPIYQFKKCCEVLRKGELGIKRSDKIRFHEPFKSLRNNDNVDDINM